MSNYTELQDEVKWLHAIHKSYLYIYLLHDAPDVCWECIQLNPVARLSIANLKELKIESFDFPQQADACMCNMFLHP